MDWRLCTRCRPQTPEGAEPVQAAPTRRENKYRLKPACHLASKYEQGMRDRTTNTAAADAAAALVAEAAARQERRKPKADGLYGLRTHCWVVVLQGRRGVPENFFIECSLGETVSTKSAQYLGVEGVWNSKNYWVNMQDCTQVCVRGPGDSAVGEITPELCVDMEAVHAEGLCGLGAADVCT